ncbi:esterase-like activity of phytase family protein [Streptomyces sp. NPDC050448]|uniref:esterase-like activity of phytase family protein n=1 Tax=Streptomyces sp. NPDC050448 TaxID=3155404 RepID=UPI003427B5D4
MGGISGLALARDGTVAGISDRSALCTPDVERGDTPTAGATAWRPPADGGGKVLDSEGIVVDRDGSYPVTDQFAPAVRRYGRAGEVLGTLPVPEAFRRSRRAAPPRTLPDARGRRPSCRRTIRWWTTWRGWR